jgi:hypothetical protein
MSVKLVYLSQSAHRLAINQGRIVPAERREFAHLPMLWVEGVPVFDSSRMRDDQVEELCERLEQITGRLHAVGIGDQVRLYMREFGPEGVRVKDVCDVIACDKSSALKYLRRLIENGEVHVKEEPTRGTGSPRKRYFWTAGRPSINQAGFGAIDESDNLNVVTNERKTADSGVIHHGAAVYGLVCSCASCQWAIEELVTVEEQSAARREGRNQLEDGVNARRVRREREIWAMQKGAAAGLAAVNG